MPPRLMIAALLAALSGCGYFSPPPKPKEPPPPPVRPSEGAKQELLRIAKRAEDAASFEALKKYLEDFDDPEKKWTWADLNESVINGGYSTPTKTAYENWRRQRAAEKNR